MFSFRFLLFPLYPIAEQKSPVSPRSAPHRAGCAGLVGDCADLYVRCQKAPYLPQVWARLLLVEASPPGGARPGAARLGAARWRDVSAPGFPLAPDHFPPVLDHFAPDLDHFHGGFHMSTSQQNGVNRLCWITFPLSCAILAGGVLHTFFATDPVTRVTGWAQNHE